MKRNLVLRLVALALTFMVLAPSAWAKEETSASVTPINYDLAFPGILPDHPLFVIKKIRDKLVASLIFDSTKKIEYLLREADKGILATALLVDKGNYDLAIQTALRAEHNYTLLAGELYRLKEKPSEETFAKLELAALKHQEVLSSLIPRMGDAGGRLDQVIEFSKMNIQSINQYKLSATAYPVR